MPKEVRCLRVPKEQAEKAIALTNKASIFDKEFEVERDERSLYIPLISQPSKDSLKTQGK
jgi:tRNA G37 N-methylase Trm5